MIEGHVHAAELSGTLGQGRSIRDLRRGGGGRRKAVPRRRRAAARRDHPRPSERNSRWWIRFVYEVTFVAFPLFLLYRIGRNFFDSLLHERPFLSTDFCVPAIVFLAPRGGCSRDALCPPAAAGAQPTGRWTGGRACRPALSQGLFPQSRMGLPGRRTADGRDRPPDGGGDETSGRPGRFVPARFAEDPPCRRDAAAFVDQPPSLCRDNRRQRRSDALTAGISSSSSSTTTIRGVSRIDPLGCSPVGGGRGRRRSPSK